MARSFSLEARSDSQKIGETRYRMSHLPSTTAIARIVLLAGILLAVTLLASRSFIPAFAQETDEVDFYENSEDSVAVYTATDPEEENIVWSLSTDPTNSPDSSFFSIDAGVLTFKSPPDFECPKPIDQGTCTTADGANTYTVIVVVQAGTGGDSTATEQPVEITVKNVEEPGNLNLMTLQPKVDAQISPTLTDDDGQSSDNKIKNLVGVAEWQWATSTSATGPWNDIDPSQDLSDDDMTDGDNANYKPRKSDVGLYLRVTATYVDGSGEDDPFTDEVDESKDTISAVSANPVAASDYENMPPKFKDRDTDKEGNQIDATFEVKEDIASGSNVGDKIVASDIGADGNEETLRYVLQDVDQNNLPSDYTFVIDSATAQISLGGNKKLDFDRDDNNDGDSDPDALQYVFYVQAYDPSNVSAAADDRAKVTIDVLNVDEAPAIAAADTATSDGLSAKSLAEFDSDGSATENEQYDRSISTYTASDPEDDRNDDRDLKWSLSGGDSGRFELFSVTALLTSIGGPDRCDNQSGDPTGSRVLLCLMEPADRESGDEVYDVTVTVTDSDNMKVSRDVDVTITNVEEEGWIVFSHVQPQVAKSFKGEHFDPDGKKTVKSRQWATSTSRSVGGTWNPISGATSESYTPQASHLDPSDDTYLRYMVEYTDGCGNETEGCSDDTLSKIVFHPVNPATTTDSPPGFYSDAGGTNAITELTLTVLENTTALTGTASFYAQDADEADLNLVLYLSGPEASKFSISTGGADPLGAIDITAETNEADSVAQGQEVTLAVKAGETIDYENSTSDHKFSFSVKAKDPSGGTEGTLSIVVTVQQEDEDPEITTKEASYSYEEHSTGNVAKFAARDPEDGTSITWTLAGSDRDDFSIDRNGNLTFDSSPDYENPTDRVDNSDSPRNVYDVTIQASDTTNNTDELEITVTVTNKEEDGTITLSTGQPKVTFSDDGEPTAMITATLIDPDGKLAATLPLCRNIAEDRVGCNTGQNDTDLTLGYHDIDTALTTEWQWATSTSATGPWNDVEGTEGTGSTYTLSESDAGLYLRASATYKDRHGVDDVDTKADESEDMVQVVSARVLMADYENEPPMFPDQEPDIPELQNSTTTRKVFENSAPGTLVGDPIAFEDEGEDGSQETLFYTLTDATPTADQIDDDVYFVIDSSTGQIRVSNAAADTDLDYESLDFAPAGANPPEDRPDYQYEVTVKATDPSNVSSTTKVIIKLLNVNEAPEVEDATETANLAATTTPEVDDDVDQGTPYNREISTYAAKDDEDTNTELKWTLSGVDSERFEFSDDVAECPNIATDGVQEQTDDEVLLCFKFGFAPDFEDPDDENGDNVYNVTVVVTDSDRNTDSRDVAVTVKNEEEDGDVALKNLVPEVGIPIEAALSDPDGGERDIDWKWWTLSITSLETQPEIQCTPDSDTPPTIRWTPISGATSQSYTPVSSDIDKCLAVTGTYRDASSENDPFTIADESIFMATGTPSYVVKDADSNNKAPVFPDQDPDTAGDQSDRAVRHVHENTKRNTEDNPSVDRNGVDTPNPFGIVGLAHIPTPIVADTDQDEIGSVDILTYSLGGPDASLFTIDTVADADATPAELIGQIRVGENTELDFETKDTYTVHVIATDPSGASDTIIVTIKVVDVDEEPKVSKKGLAVSGDRSVTVAEGNSGDLASYTASGADASGARWSLEGTDAGDFNISSGILAFRSTPNYESPADSNSDNVYNVTVKATSGNISATRSVTVTVTNVNEDGSVSISPSGQPRVGTALTASVTDLDGSVTGITWQWASSSNGSTGWGDISGARSATYTPVDGDAGNFLRATASYTDGHGPGKSENDVTSSAVAAAGPAFVVQDGSVSLSPSQPIAGQAVTATLSDPDSGETNFSWSWARSSTAGDQGSTIAGATGSSYTPGQADVGMYLQATVTYDDSDGTGNSASGVTANPVELIDSYDANADARIDGPEVLTAVAAYFRNEISPQRVLAVVALYFAGLS